MFNNKNNDNCKDEDFELAIPLSVVLFQVSLIVLWIKKPLVWMWIWFFWTVLDDILKTKQK